jgi:Baseplate J-like protein
MSQYAKDMKQILAALEEPEEDQPLPDEQEEVLHAYPVKIGGVEGVLYTKQEVAPEYTTDATFIESERPQDKPDHAPASVKREPPYFLYFVLILLLFLVLDNVNSVLTSLFTPTATITVVTNSHQFSTNAVFTIPITTFKQVSFTEAGSSPTTGKGHQNATLAHGGVTFYNSLPQSQTIEAGTLVTGSDGVQVTTDEAAYVPAGSFSGNGQISVSAHAINPGESGNIGAGDISGTCCRAYILVRNNGAFTGGQNARDFQFVTTSDMKDVQSTLFVKINGEKQKAQEQVPARDSLLSPIPCATSSQSNHRVGDEATNLSVTVTQNCTIASYSPQAFHKRLMTEFSQSILHQFGIGYTLLGSPTGHITDTKIQPGQIEFQVAAMALYGLDFSASRTNELSEQIAGKSRQATLNILKRETGVNKVTLDLPDGMNSLPTDTTKIHFIVIYQQEISTS